MSTRPSQSPTPADLKWFGVLQLPFWGFIVWLQQVRLGGMASAIVLSIATLLAVLGIFRPTALHPIYRSWTFISEPAGWLVSQCALAVLYFTVILPIGLLLRWRRHDPLQRRWPATESTGWRKRPDSPPVERYFRQY